MKNEAEKVKNVKNGNVYFRNLTFGEIKCISLEAPLIAGLKYTTCFLPTPMVFEKIMFF